MSSPAPDDEFRAAMFAYLDRVVAEHGDAIPWRILQNFEFGGARRSLVTQRGIRWLSGGSAVAFTTTFTPPGKLPPYLDAEGDDGLPRYKYQGTDPARADNVAMKLAEAEGKPVAWFVGTAPGVYQAIYPVWIVDHDDQALEFTAVVDGEQRAAVEAGANVTPDGRKYLRRLTRQRLHQPLFRAQVLRAYSTRCTICRLRHANLLDAAHIRPDEDGGQPVVTNGLALCKIHHAAFDEHLLAVTPSYQVEIARSVLTESDGPMLLHGLQEMHGRPIELPRRKIELPDRDALSERYQAFLRRAS
jgi:putative restriction endonuclease